MQKKYVFVAFFSIAFCMLTYQKFSFTISTQMSTSERILNLLINSDISEVQKLLNSVTLLADVRGQSGETILHRAAEMGTPSVLKEVLYKGSVGINVQDSIGRTPIMWAIATHNLPTLKKLLELGVDVSIKDKAGMNALELARDYRQQVLFMDVGPGILRDFDEMIALLQEKMR